MVNYEWQKSRNFLKQNVAQKQTKKQKQIVKLLI